ncbi:MAG: hypothetical protein H0W83_15835 [Planctomycetes bacterium]|nr:hypothetical protein [Planctomycetota bacterium]
MNNTRLAAQKIEVLPHAEVLAKLKDAGLTDDDIELLLTLMTEKTNTVAGDKPLSARLLSGDIPDRIEITSFRGTKGTMLLNMGRESRLQTANFQGRLIRFSGAGWPMGWHVLDVRLTTN